MKISIDRKRFGDELPIEINQQVVVHRPGSSGVVRGLYVDDRRGPRIERRGVAVLWVNDSDTWYYYEKALEANMIDLDDDFMGIWRAHTQRDGVASSH